MNEEVLRYLLDEFEIEESDVFHIDGPLDLTFMFSFVKGISVGREHLEYESFIPQPPLDLQSDENIFEKHFNRIYFSIIHMNLLPLLLILFLRPLLTRMYWL